MWWGLVVDGELLKVKWFRKEPIIWDFNYGIISSQNQYEIVPVRVSAPAGIET
jgi:hypothetical protein